jgi:hypothetical protein
MILREITDKYWTPDMKIFSLQLIQYLATLLVKKLLLLLLFLSILKIYIHDKISNDWAKF